jgi:hypothetical protein
MSEKKSVVAKHIPPAPLRRGESMKSEVLPYSIVTKPLARELRKNQTGAEELLWFRIRRKQMREINHPRWSNFCRC